MTDEQRRERQQNIHIGWNLRTMAGLAVCLAFLAAVIADFLVPAYEIPMPVSGLMAAFVGYLFKDIFTKDKQ